MDTAINNHLLLKAGKLVINIFFFLISEVLDLILLSYETENSMEEEAAMMDMHYSVLSVPSRL